MKDRYRGRPTYNQVKRGKHPAAKGKDKVNPLRIDPSRTLALRRTFSTFIKGKFDALKIKVLRLVVDEDSFGLTRLTEQEVHNLYVTNPFVSEAQRRACWAADDPDWDCKEWEHATDKSKGLPEEKATINLLSSVPFTLNWEERSLASGILANGNPDQQRDSQGRFAKEHESNESTASYDTSYHNEMHGREVATRERPEAKEFHDDHMVRVEKEVDEILGKGGERAVSKVYADWKGSAQIHYYVKGELRGGIDYNKIADKRSNIGDVTVYDGSAGGRSVQVLEVDSGADRAAKLNWALRIKGANKPVSNFSPDQPRGPDGKFLGSGSPSALFARAKESVAKLKAHVGGSLKAAIDRLPYGQALREKTSALKSGMEDRYGKKTAARIFLAANVVSWGAFVAGPLVGYPNYIPASVLIGVGCAIAEAGVQVKRAVDKLNPLRGIGVANEGFYNHSDTMDDDEWETIHGELSDKEVKREAHALFESLLEEGWRLHQVTAGSRHVDPPLPFSQRGVANEDWSANKDSEKVKKFREWLAKQVEEDVLDATTEEMFKRFTKAAYQKGGARAFDDASKVRRLRDAGTKGDDFYQGGREEFLRSAFNRPIAEERVAILTDRSFSDLRGVTDAMSAKMTRALADGLTRGDSPHDVGRALSDEVDGIGRVRGEMIARTEVIRAHSEGQLDSLEAMGVDQVGVQVEWEVTPDDRLCPLCESLDGVVLDLDDARGLLPRHPNCVIGESVIKAGDALALMETHYTGQIIELVTAKGRRIAVTPHHILLTENGFLHAAEIGKGTHLVDASLTDGMFDAPYDDRNVSPVSDVFKSLSECPLGIVDCVPLAPEDLHGDGGFCNQEVNIVWPNRKLWNQVDSISGKVKEGPFIPLQGGNVEGLLSARGSAAKFLERVAFAFDRSMGRSRDLLATNNAKLLHLDSVGVGLVSGSDAGLSQSSVNNAPGTIEHYGKGIGTHPPKEEFNDLLRWNELTIVFDRVTSAEVRHVEDLPVYDVQTQSTLYHLNGIISSNCRCCWMPAGVGESGEGQITGKAADKVLRDTGTVARNALHGLSRFLTNDVGADGRWVTLETGQHVFIGPGGELSPEGPGPFDKAPEKKTDTEHKAGDRVKWEGMNGTVVSISTAGHPHAKVKVDEFGGAEVDVPLGQVKKGDGSAAKTESSAETSQRQLKEATVRAKTSGSKATRPEDIKVGGNSLDHWVAAIKQAEKLTPDMQSPDLSIRKMIEANSMDVGEHQVHGMSSPAAMRGIVLKGGLVLRWENGMYPEYTIMELAKHSLPKELMGANEHITLTKQRNKDDLHWEKKYGISGFMSSATGGDGGIVVYNGSTPKISTIAHESGHNLAAKMWGATSPPAYSSYADAQAVEKPVTDYGSKNPAEDFAEACRMYSSQKDRQKLKDKWPEKHTALSKMLTVPT